MGALFEKVVAFENLHAAAWEVLRGKRGRPGANRFFLRLEDELLQLQRELEEDRYRTIDSFPRSITTSSKGRFEGRLETDVCFG